MEDESVPRKGLQSAFTVKPQELRCQYEPCVSTIPLDPVAGTSESTPAGRHAQPGTGHSEPCPDSRSEKDLAGPPCGSLHITGPMACSQCGHAVCPSSYRSMFLMHVGRPKPQLSLFHSELRWASEMAASSNPLHRAGNLT
jgi:hypothetical protein